MSLNTAQSRRKLAEIEKQLQGATRRVNPSNWLTALLSSRCIDDKTASAYLLQSPYYKGSKWDLPEEDEDWDESERSFEYDEPEDTEDGEGDEGNAEAETGAVDPWKIENERLQQRFMDIFNDILLFFGLGASRRVLATETTDDEEDDIFYQYDASWSEGPPRFSTRPDLLLLGEDVRQLPRSLDSYDRGMSANPEGRLELYRGCVAVGKVQKVGGRSGSDALLAKVATCAECVPLSLSPRSRLNLL